MGRGGGGGSRLRDAWSPNLTRAAAAVRQRHRDLETDFVPAVASIMQVPHQLPVLNPKPVSPPPSHPLTLASGRRGSNPPRGVIVRGAAKVR